MLYVFIDKFTHYCLGRSNICFPDVQILSSRNTCCNFERKSSCLLLPSIVKVRQYTIYKFNIQYISLVVGTNYSSFLFDVPVVSSFFSVQFLNFSQFSSYCSSTLVHVVNCWLVCMQGTVTLSRREVYHSSMPCSSACQRLLHCNGSCRFCSALLALLVFALMPQWCTVHLLHSEDRA